jgi:pimeloyl-ACP methyl ester carboxylesterase
MENKSEVDFVLVDGGKKVAFEDSGERNLPVLIALPGMGDLRQEYRFLQEKLSGCMRIITVDIRGHGESDAQAWSDYSAKAIAGDVLEIMKKTGVEAAVIAGCSFAAGVCLWMNKLDESSVAGMVLLGPVVRDAPANTFMTGMMHVLFCNLWGVSAWVAFWKGLFKKNLPVDLEEYSTNLRKNLNEKGRLDALKTMIFLSKAETSALLEEGLVEKPALIVMGTADPDFSNATDEANWLNGKLQSSELMLLEGVGHYPQVECPEEVADAIKRKFLK